MDTPRHEPAVDALVVDKRDLPHSGNSHEFEGYSHGDASVSFIWVDMPPGAGVRLHRHSYKEIFIVQEGQATYTVGSARLDVRAQQVVIVPAGVAHGFVNSGAGMLRQIDIHLSPKIVTEWL